MLSKNALTTISFHFHGAQQQTVFILFIFIYFCKHWSCIRLYVSQNKNLTILEYSSIIQILHLWFVIKKL
jgi:hypothetical protein